MIHVHEIEQYFYDKTKTDKLRECINLWVCNSLYMGLCWNGFLTIKLLFEGNNTTDASTSRSKAFYREGRLINTFGYAKSKLRKIMSQFEREILGRGWIRNHIRFIAFAELGESQVWHFHVVLGHPCNYGNEDRMFLVLDKIRETNNLSTYSLKFDNIVYDENKVSTVDKVVNYCTKEILADSKGHFNSDRIIISEDLFGISGRDPHYLFWKKKFKQWSRKKQEAVLDKMDKARRILEQMETKKDAPRLIMINAHREISDEEFIKAYSWKRPKGGYGKRRRRKTNPVPRAISTTKEA